MTVLGTGRKIWQLGRLPLNTEVSHGPILKAKAEGTHPFFSLPHLPCEIYFKRSGLSLHPPVKCATGGSRTDSQVGRVAEKLLSSQVVLHRSLHFLGG